MLIMHDVLHAAGWLRWLCDGDGDGWVWRRAVHSSHLMPSVVSPRGGTRRYCRRYRRCRRRCCCCCCCCRPSAAAAAATSLPPCLCRPCHDDPSPLAALRVLSFPLLLFITRPSW